MGSERSNERGLPKVWQCTTSFIRACNIWVGLLDLQKCESALEFGVDDQEWLHKDIVGLNFVHSSPIGDHINLFIARGVLLDISIDIAGQKLISFDE